MDTRSNSDTPQDTVYEEIESFFDSAPPLKDRSDISRKIDEFIARNSQSGKFISDSCFPLATASPYYLFALEFIKVTDIFHIFQEVEELTGLCV